MREKKIYENNCSTKTGTRKRKFPLSAPALYGKWATTVNKDRRSFQGLGGEESACQTGDVVLVPGSGSSPGGGNGNPLQCSCLGNPMDRRAGQATIHGMDVKSWT